MIQTAKQQTWTDSSGTSVPFNRVTANERKKEVAAARLLKSAFSLAEQLAEFKLQIEKASKEFYEEVLKKHKGDTDKKPKGNYTWYNFDKSVRIEVNATERIEFQEPEIGLAKQKLDAFISDSLGSADAFVHQLVNDAFQNNKGSLDAKKVLGLIKYRSKTKAVKFHEALDLIEKSIDRNSGKIYYKIASKNDKGEYEYIKLNISDL